MKKNQFFEKIMTACENEVKVKLQNRTSGAING